MKKQFNNVFHVFQCTALESEVSQKDDLLSHSKSHAANVEAEHDEISATVKTLQKSIKDKELRITNLEEKNESLLEEHEREINNMQQQMKSLQTKVLEKEVVSSQLYFFPFAHCIMSE